MEPLESDQLHDITIAAYKAQGYTYQGTNAKNPQVLHDEHVYGWIKKILILAKDRRTENKIKE